MRGVYQAEPTQPAGKNILSRTEYIPAVCVHRQLESHPGATFAGFTPVHGPRDLRRTPNPISTQRRNTYNMRGLSEFRAQARIPRPVGMTRHRPGIPSHCSSSSTDACHAFLSCKTRLKRGEEARRTAPKTRGRLVSEPLAVYKSFERIQNRATYTTPIQFHSTTAHCCWNMPFPDYSPCTSHLDGRTVWLRCCSTVVLPASAAGTCVIKSGGMLPNLHNPVCPHPAAPATLHQRHKRPTDPRTLALIPRRPAETAVLTSARSSCLDGVRGMCPVLSGACGFHSKIPHRQLVPCRMPRFMPVNEDVGGNRPIDSIIQMKLGQARIIHSLLRSRQSGAW